MSEQHEDLRATAESIAGDADRLAVIEEKKAALEDDDPKLVALSREALRIARDLVPKTAAELELAADGESSG
ncbi:MAG: hypothetical protein QOE42_1175 [Chloroflexota bacterium]|jgi:hypothetical protein|nr:hypothetical protein [Chloroflexota bacterium]